MTPVTKDDLVYTPWNLTQVEAPTRIVEVPAAPDDVERYAARYSLSKGYLLKDFRYRIEIYQEFDLDSSVILLGSGHPSRSNFIIKENPNVSQLTAVDYTVEASIGLDPSIEFLCADIVSDDLSIDGDYIFSSHTVEHFTRSEILDSILPKCLSMSRKAVVFVVPYGDNWGDEPSHKCRFYEHDELCALSTKWKRIHNGQELALMFEIK